MKEILIQRTEHQKISGDAPLLAFSYAEGVISPEDKKSNKRDFIMTDKYNKIFSRTELNDIIYNPANVVHGAIHRNKLGTGVVSPIYKIFMCNGVSPKFIGERLHTDKFILEVTKFIEGTVVKLRTLSPEMFLEMSIEIPKSYEEQDRIGTYFTSLDNLITLHQRKYNKLLNVKKSMLEKMFPKNGSNIPEIRFKGFTDPWEQRKFEDVTFLSGEKNKNNLPFESYSVTNENGFVPQNEQFENGGTMATADKRMYYIVSKNSFAYNPARINVGSIGYYDGSENVIVSSLYEVFKTSEDIDDRYLWHWFKSNNFKKLIEQYQEGGVRLYFYYDKLCMCSLPTPSIQEQVKIGRYFDNLDNLITLHQREF